VEKWREGNRIILQRTHRGRREMERGRQRSSPIASVAEAVMKEGRRRRNTVAVLGARCLRSGRAKLGWGVSTVRHREGLGAFYRASDGAERTEGRTTGGGSVELQWRGRFGLGRKWEGVTWSRGDERGSGTDSFFCHGRGGGVVQGRRAGGGGARSGGGGLAFGRRKEKGSLASAGPNGYAGLDGPV
jgi:hypothetical protein